MTPNLQLFARFEVRLGIAQYKSEIGGRSSHVEGWGEMLSSLLSFSGLRVVYLRATHLCKLLFKFHPIENTNSCHIGVCHWM